MAQVQFPLCDSHRGIHGSKAICKQCVDVEKRKKKITCALMSQKKDSRREVTMTRGAWVNCAGSHSERFTNYFLIVGKDCIWTARRPVRLDQVRDTGMRFGRIDIGQGMDGVDELVSEDEPEQLTQFAAQPSTPEEGLILKKKTLTLNLKQEDISVTIARRRQALDINFLRQ